jgi:regulatory protein YycI of two-component signal transduction system YycFG
MEKLTKEKNLNLLLIILIFIILFFILYIIYFYFFNNYKNIIEIPKDENQNNLENDEISDINKLEESEKSSEGILIGENSNIKTEGSNSENLNEDHKENLIPEDIESKPCGYYYSEYGICTGICPEGNCINYQRSCYCIV